jgi:hypothetical protein
MLDVLVKLHGSASDHTRIRAAPAMRGSACRSLLASMAAIITPPCAFFAASLVRPVQGLFVLAVTFDQNTVGAMRQLLRSTLEAEYGAFGRQAALPLTDIAGGRWLIRFVSKEAPRVVNSQGLQVIVQPAAGSILSIEAQLQPMRSHVGVIPVMQRIVVLQFVSQPPTALNRGTVG